VFGLFSILGSPPVWRLVGGLFNKSPEGSLNVFQGSLKGLNQAFGQDHGLRYKLIDKLGGLKISWPQTLLHAVLAGLLTGLITYLAMSPGKDKETCPKDASIEPFSR
jgi:hypothetical protein